MDRFAGSKMTRRGFLRVGAAVGATLPLISVLRRPAYAAEFEYKFATGQDPAHPVNKRAQEAIDRIQEATNGRVKITLFPANQLGSDTDLLSQVRSGGVELFILSTGILASFVPVAGIFNTGFAFPDYDAVWKAADGDLGNHVRAEIANTPILAVANAWDNGFRQVSSSTREIRTPVDLKGLKIRVPLAPVLTSLFKALDAGPTPINANELYSALQTKVVEAQENSLPIISSMRLYEVQTKIMMTNHVWDGFWILGNKRAWAKLPEDARAIVTRELNRSGVDQRADVAALSQSLRNDLASKGIQFSDVDRAPFRHAVAKTSYYKDWKAKYGDEAWTMLEKVVGPLGS